MATYKLIQDIEAEDKILGPLTLRQFIFALIAAFFFYLSFVAVTKDVPFLLVLFLPPALFCGFFALPFGRDQPTEIWALAKLRFWFKPRKRVWNQSGVKEVVTINVPKKVERVLTNGLSQTEVKSRLKALADTLDTRGWAVKHINEAQPFAPAVVGGSSDRLIDIGSLPQEVPSDDVSPSDDILDDTSSPIARQFTSMIDQSTQARRQQLMDELNGIRQTQAATAGTPGGNWFMNPAAAAAPAATTAAPADSADEAALAAQLAGRRTNTGQVSFGNLRTIQPLGSAPAVAADNAAVPPPAPAAVSTAVNTPAPTVTAPSDPAILSLAKNDDLNVATLAREAQKKHSSGAQPPDEVVIPLH